MSPTLIQMDTASPRISMAKTTATESKTRLTSPRDPVDMFISLDDDNSCETYFCSRDSCPSVRSVLPEASEAFREALGKLKLESAGNPNEKSGVTSSSTSAPTTSCSRAKTSCPLKTNTMPIVLPSPMSCRPTDASNNKLLKPQKPPSSRRPASFGGADLVKPRTATRRASHCEKRVTWADEKGADRQLISVRLIRPRLSADTNLATNSSPSQSILRNTGT